LNSYAKAGVLAPFFGLEKLNLFQASGCKLFLNIYGLGRRRMEEASKSYPPDGLEMLSLESYTGLTLG
jgi:hypothetical protein